MGEKVFAQNTTDATNQTRSERVDGSFENLFLVGIHEAIVP